MTRPSRVTLYEVGPRDGLQAEAQIVPVATKIELINRLSQTGLSMIEAASFVSPKWVPQMADAEAVMAGIERLKRIPKSVQRFSDINARQNKNLDVHYTALAPNLQGYDRAIASGADQIAVFASASETFSQKNINCSIADSLARFESVMVKAAQAHIKVRAYVSCVVGCPYEGKIAPEAVLSVSQKLLAMGCYEVSLGDTIGVATPADTERLLDVLTAHIPAQKLAVHFHDTYGQALANILTALDYGISTIDASVGGLGGCPYAPKSSETSASGNVATEDVLYMLNGLGIETGVDLDKLIDAAWYISDVLGRPPRSKLAVARGR